MGGKGSGPRRARPGITAYWAKFTPEQRSIEMKRRQALAKKRGGARWSKHTNKREIPSTESPFVEEVSPAIASSSRSLKALLADLENVVSELKTMFGV